MQDCKVYTLNAGSSILRKVPVPFGDTLVMTQVTENEYDIPGSLTGWERHSA
jgi:hypothetical protein